MLVAIFPIAAMLLFLFLGSVQSHWIAPAVLFVISAPIIIEMFWGLGLVQLGEALIGTIVFYYASFALGRFFGGGASR